MPVADYDGFELSESESKEASALYNKYFADSVNSQSFGRWTVENVDGSRKAWTLSNTCHSGPKGWLMGGNYWPDQWDILSSKPFVIPDGTDGLRLTFYARWSMGEFADCQVNWNHNGQFAEGIDQFMNGTNPDYPGYTRYSYNLPANFSGQDETMWLDFSFSASPDPGTFGWGICIDDVAVYRRLLNPPNGVVASDTFHSAIVVDWEHNNNGTLAPDEYAIFRSSAPDGPFVEISTIPYPGTEFSEFPPDGSTYWYLVRSRKTGWTDSADSNIDSGHLLPD
jgi:hypothetical protein